MAKAFALVSALCFLALASFAHAQVEKAFNVNGQIYCDPCGVEFLTKLTTPIAGARVQLQCRNRDTGVVSITVETETDKDGNYNMNVSGDHEEEICEVSTLSSPDPKCNVPFTIADKARVLLTDNSGVQGTSRYANPLGFKTAQPAGACIPTLAELGIRVVS